MIKRTRTAFAYELEASETTGPLQPASNVVKYRKATTKRQFATILMLAVSTWLTQPPWWCFYFYRESRRFSPEASR